VLLCALAVRRKVLLQDFRDSLFSGGFIVVVESLVLSGLAGFAALFFSFPAGG